MRVKELQDIIAPFRVHTEVQSYDLKGKPAVQRCHLDGPKSVAVTD